MARKGNIEININKENPILTIIKNGKIPVVRVGIKGFQNYNQARYFEGKDREVALERGCFVSVVGIQGTFVSGGHYGEAIHIGYLEPYDEVFCTYTYHKTVFAFQSAKERFEQAKADYEEYMKGVKEKNYDTEDYDLFSEAIVDSRKIKKATVIEPNDFHILFHFCDDGVFRFYGAEDIFHHLLWEGKLKEEVMDHFSWEIKDCHHPYFGEIEVEDFMANCHYQKIVLEDIKNFYTKGSFIRTKEFYKELQDGLTEYAERIKKYDGEYGIFSRFSETSINLSFTEEKYSDKIRITASSDKDTVKLVHTKTPGWWRNDYTEEVIDDLVLNEDTILNKEYIQQLFIIVEKKTIFDECLGKFFKINYPKWLVTLDRFKRLYDSMNSLGNLITWSFNGKYCEIDIEREEEKNPFKFQYSLILKEGVLELYNPDTSESEFYNMENIPKYFDTTIFNIILETLKETWES